MNYLNIEISSLRSTEFIGADPIARATWLCLMGYCADQENGGIIKDCSDWGDRRWMQTCAVTRAEIDASKPLAFWDATSLHLMFYPVQQESKFQANRINGKKGGRPKGSPQIKPDGKPKKNHMVQSGVNVKEEEEEKKEEEKKEFSLDGSNEPKKQKTFKQLTKEEFKEQCKIVSEGILEEDDAIAFFRYWIEPDTKGRMKFQKQDTWDIKLRMITWLKHKERMEAKNVRNG